MSTDNWYLVIEHDHPWDDNKPEAIGPFFKKRDARKYQKRLIPWGSVEQLFPPKLQGCLVYDPQSMETYMNERGSQ